MPPHPLRLLALSLAVSPSIVLGATYKNTTSFGTCPIRPPKTLPYERPKDLDKDAVYVEANNALLNAESLSELKGNVFIDDGTQTLVAHEATYANKTKDVTGTGKVFLKSELLEINSDAIEYNLNTQVGAVFNAYYHMPKTGAHGTSKEIKRQGKFLTDLNNASYTACPQGDNTWRIHAKDIQLDQKEEHGVARNVTLRIKDVPVFYFPYYSFPLGDKRKSGFLTPAFKSDDKSGVQISTPYYFNLAPNYDYTLTPTVLSKRGVLLGNEFRYLDEDFEGKMTYNALPEDKLYNDELRYQFDLFHKMKVGEKGTLIFKAGGVSDKDYINDLEDSLAATSTINLERNISYSTRGRDWSFAAVAQDFQVLDNATDPYSRAPQLTFKYKPEALNQRSDFKIETETQYTNFYSRDKDDAQRLNLKIKASYNKNKSWGFFRPSLTLNHTHYEQKGDSGISISRTLPTISIDTGLIFERELNDTYKQTLEPRIFYTHTPYKNQDHIPNFDSGVKTLTFNRLFDENSFTGKDRVADANQITTAVTTRFHNKKTGREKLRLSAGQVYYFDDRKVTLPNGTPQTGNRSELVFEASGEIAKNTRLTSTTFLNTGDKQITRNSLKLRYQNQKEQIFNVSYDYKRDDFRSTKVSFATPINERWSAAGSINYDLENKRKLESVAGLEYNSCCWKTRIAGRRYLLNDNETYDNAILLELELKGLGSFGSSATNLLRDRISGFK